LVPSASQFASIVAAVDELAGRLVEVNVELTTIAHPRSVTQLREREGVGLGERFVCLP
jgi:hypothetical protein